MKKSVHPAVIAVVVVLVLGGVLLIYQRAADPGHISEDQAARIRAVMRTAPPMMMPGTPHENTGTSPKGTTPDGGK